MGRLGNYRRWLDRSGAGAQTSQVTPSGDGDTLKGDNMTGQMEPENVAILARMLIERRDLAARAAAEMRNAQRQHDWPYSATADRLEGSAAAYSVACSIVTGLMREPNIEVIAGGVFMAHRQPIDIAATVDLDADNGRGAVFAEPSRVDDPDGFLNPTADGSPFVANLR